MRRCRSGSYGSAASDDAVAGTGRCRVGFLPLAFVILLGNIGEYELIAVAGDRPDKARLARVVAEDTANRADGLTERAVRDDDIAPDMVENVPAMHRVAAPFDEENEEIEVAWNQRLFAAISREHAAARRQKKLVEAISRH